MIQGMDHYGHLALERCDISEGVVYTGTGVERVIPMLTEGDRVRLRRGASYGQLELVVVDTLSEETFVTDGDRVYELTPGHWHNGESSPWLRLDGDSTGRVERLTVTHLADE